jgi:hypothetical protein
MKLLVEWDNPEKTIIRITYAEKWTWSDFYEANMVAVAMMKTVDHTVHFLADFRQSRSLPIGGAITHARAALTALPDNWGILVIVSTSILIQRLVSIFRTAFTGKMSTKTYSVTSIEEAYRVIAQQDSSTLIS